MKGDESQKEKSMCGKITLYDNASRRSKSKSPKKDKSASLPAGINLNFISLSQASTLQANDVDIVMKSPSKKNNLNNDGNTGVTTESNQLVSPKKKIKKGSSAEGDGKIDFLTNMELVSASSEIIATNKEAEKSDQGSQVEALKSVDTPRKRKNAEALTNGAVSAYEENGVVATTLSAAQGDDCITVSPKKKRKLDFSPNEHSEATKSTENEDSNKLENTVLTKNRKKKLKQKRRKLSLAETNNVISVNGEDNSNANEVAKKKITSVDNEEENNSSPNKKKRKRNRNKKKSLEANTEGNATISNGISENIENTEVKKRKKKKKGNLNVNDKNTECTKKVKVKTKVPVVLKKKKKSNSIINNEEGSTPHKKRNKKKKIASLVVDAEGNTNIVSTASVILKTVEKYGAAKKKKKVSLHAESTKSTEEQSNAEVSIVAEKRTMSAKRVSNNEEERNGAQKDISESSLTKSKLPNSSDDENSSCVDEFPDLDMSEALSPRKQDSFLALEDIPEFLADKTTLAEVTTDQIDKIQNLAIFNDFDVHKEHMIEQKIFYQLSKQYRDKFSGMGMLSKLWTKKEDDILKANWQKFMGKYNLDEEDWVCFDLDLNVADRETTCLEFYRFLGQGLPKRTLQSIHRRFVHLKRHGGKKKRATYTKEEDQFINEFMEKYNGQNTALSNLAKIMGRDRQSLKRHMERMTKNSENEEIWPAKEKKFEKYPFSSITKLIQTMMECTSCESVAVLLKKKRMPWTEVAEKLKTDPDKVYRCWTYYVCNAIKLTEKISKEEVAIGTIDAILEQRCNDLLEVNWKKVAKKVKPFHKMYLQVLLHNRLRTVKQKETTLFHRKYLKRLKIVLEEKVTEGKVDYFYPLEVSENGEVIKRCE